LLLESLELPNNIFLTLGSCHARCFSIDGCHARANIVLSGSRSGHRHVEYSLLLGQEGAGSLPVEALLTFPSVNRCFLFSVMVGCDIDEFTGLSEAEAAATKGLRTIVAIDDCFVCGWNGPD